MLYELRDAKALSPSSYRVHVIAADAVFRAIRGIMPTNKPLDPLSLRIRDTESRMGDDCAFEEGVSVVDDGDWESCSRVLRTSKGWVAEVAASPADALHIIVAVGGS